MVIRQTHRTPHARRTRTLRMSAKTPLAGDNIDPPDACAVPFCPYCWGVVTRTRNVTEYMLVLALCLVNIAQRSTATHLRHGGTLNDRVTDKTACWRVSFESEATFGEVASEMACVDIGHSQSPCQGRSQKFILGGYNFFTARQSYILAV